MQGTCWASVDDIKMHAQNLGRAALSHVPYVLRRQSVPEAISGQLQGSWSELRKIGQEVAPWLAMAAGGLLVKHFWDQHQQQLSAQNGSALTSDNAGSQAVPANIGVAAQPLPSGEASTLAA